MTMDLDADVVPLRRVLRDLVALSAIPAVWVGKEPSAIAAELAELVATSLYLDFVFVRFRDPNGNAAVEITRGTGGPPLRNGCITIPLRVVICRTSKSFQARTTIRAKVAALSFPLV